MSEDDSKTPPPDERPKEDAVDVVEEPAAAYAENKPAVAAMPPSDISDTLKPPQLPHVNPDAITQEQVFSGIVIHIPGSVKLCEGDVIIFYWGRNASQTQVYHRVGANSIVRAMCLSYHFMAEPQYGLVDLYYEIHRDTHLIGTSPALKVTVNYSPPLTPKQRQRKRWISRRFPDN
ncbi:hypothetical protein [Pseudomonas viridiflava]|uniref:hypothetical protein n=1 Tax=Pseudomonas viridiflava TaxID=33069 RepID=UPI000F0282E8|nr:hypothetical protein [Pseudomonas viridiflava]MDY0936448.1 hypothetical protein [Pseudomonas viridiflava]MDY1013272.1 hypothetical protein [Pseudomonas viridiflava]